MAASEILLNIVFYTVALITLVGAVMTATSRNIVRSAFSLLAVLFGAAGLYAIMKADFIAAAQVLIYVGGILVLIIFAVMLTHRITDVKLSNESTPGPAALCACLCLLFSLVIVIVTPLSPKKWKRGSQELPAEGAPGMVLLQYQADGKTGLPSGGATFEEEVVIGINADKRPEDALRFAVEAWPAALLIREDAEKMLSEKISEGEIIKSIDERGSKELSPRDVAALKKAGASDKVLAKMQEKGKRPHVASELLAKSGPTFVRLSKLNEGPHRWRAALQGTSEEPRWLGGSEFVVYRGITEPAARMLAGPYLFAFEVVSVLLLAALIGAAYLARKEVKEL